MGQHCFVVCCTQKINKLRQRNKDKAEKNIESKGGKNTELSRRLMLAVSLTVKAEISSWL